MGTWVHNHQVKFLTKIFIFRLARLLFFTNNKITALLWGLLGWTFSCHPIIFTLVSLHITHKSFAFYFCKRLHANILSFVMESWSNPVVGQTLLAGFVPLGLILS